MQITSRLKIFRRPILSLLLPLTVALTAAAAVTSTGLNAWTFDKKSALPGRPATELTCSDAFITAQVMLAIHLTPSELDDRFSRRVLGNILKDFDPYKTILGLKDVKDLTSRYGNKLDDDLFSEKCVAIRSLFAELNKIYHSYNRHIAKITKNSRLNFDKHEFINLDPQTIKYATSRKKLTNRRRQSVKFNILNLGYSQIADEVDIGLGKDVLLTKSRRNLTEPLFPGAEDMYASFLRALAKSLDLHSDYFDERELSDFRVRTSLKMVGVGVVVTESSGVISVTKIIKGSPADGKIRAKEFIVAGSKAGKMVEFFGLDLGDVVDILRGLEGTKIDLKIKGLDGKIRKERITRRPIELTKDRVSSRIIKRGSGTTGSRNVTIGVLTVPSFYLDFDAREKNEVGYSQVSEDARSALTELKKNGSDVIVLDLRGNGGGALDEAVRMTGLFMAGKTVVQIRAFGGMVQRLNAPRGLAVWDGPLAVLIDKNSASASEIVAGALGDHNRAIIVGDRRTFGKGSVQTLQTVIPNKGSVKITTAQFFSPGGSSTQLLGVKADIQIPSASDRAKIGEVNLGPGVIPWSRVPAAIDVPLVHRPNFLPGLIKRSAERVKADPRMAAIPDLPDFSRVNLTIEGFLSNGNAAREGEEKEVEDLQLEESVNIAADLFFLNGKGIKNTGFDALPSLQFEDLR